MWCLLEEIELRCVEECGLPWAAHGLVHVFDGILLGLDGIYVLGCMGQRIAGCMEVEVVVTASCWVLEISNPQVSRWVLRAHEDDFIIKINLAFSIVKNDFASALAQSSYAN